MNTRPSGAKRSVVGSVRPLHAVDSVKPVGSAVVAAAAAVSCCAAGLSKGAADAAAGMKSSESAHTSSERRRDGSGIPAPCRTRE
jgi:hypothetical protein